MARVSGFSGSVAVQTEREKNTLRAKRKFRLQQLTERFSALFLAFTLLAIWQIAVPLSGLSEFILPTPLAIANRIANELPLLASHGYITLFEVLAGFGMGVAIGIPLSLLIFYSRAFEKAVYPLLVALQTIPKVALAPILVLYLGYGWAPKSPLPS
tara:strand:+ start:98 stop:565 length:468 start_codon:yes stop_codon:yes gene_type:complete